MRNRRLSNRPIPYVLVPRCFDLLPIQDTLASIAHEVLPEAGANDHKYFEAVDMIPMAMPKEDVTVMSAALLSIGVWENDPKVMDLFHRIPHMRMRIKGALQDRQDMPW